MTRRARGARGIQGVGGRGGIVRGDALTRAFWYAARRRSRTWPPVTMRFAINRDAMVHERAGGMWRAPRPGRERRVSGARLGTLMKSAARIASSSRRRSHRREVRRPLRPPRHGSQRRCARPPSRDRPGDPLSVSSRRHGRGPSRGAAATRLQRRPRDPKTRPRPWSDSGGRAASSASRLAVITQFADDIRAGVIATEGGPSAAPTSRAPSVPDGHRRAMDPSRRRRARTSRRRPMRRPCGVLERRLVPAPPRVEPGPPAVMTRTRTSDPLRTHLGAGVSANLTLDGPSTAKRKRGRPPKTAAPAESSQSPSRPRGMRRSSPAIDEQASSVFIGEAPTVPGLRSVPQIGGVPAARAGHVDSTAELARFPPGANDCGDSPREGIVDGPGVWPSLSSRARTHGRTICSGVFVEGRRPAAVNGEGEGRRSTQRRQPRPRLSTATATATRSPGRPTKGTRPTPAWRPAGDRAIASRRRRHLPRAPSSRPPARSRGRPSPKENSPQSRADDQGGVPRPRPAGAEGGVVDALARRLCRRRRRRRRRSGPSATTAGARRVR